MKAPEKIFGFVRGNISLLAAVLFWLGAVVGGWAFLTGYSNRADRAGDPPKLWPEESALARSHDRPTLLVIAHPRCPCTRATLGELGRLLATGGGGWQVHVLFLQPAGVANDWVETDLWRTAAELPNTTIHRDVEGVEAHRFHAETSGQVLLYGREGQLKFAGGITPSRGHWGDSPGRSAILAQLADQPPQAVKTPVFGCSLFASLPCRPSAL